MATIRKIRNRVRGNSEVREGGKGDPRVLFPSSGWGVVKNQPLPGIGLIKPRTKYIVRRAKASPPGTGIADLSLESAVRCLPP